MRRVAAIGRGLRSYCQPLPKNSACFLLLLQPAKQTKQMLRFACLCFVCSMGSFVHDPIHHRPTLVRYLLVNICKLALFLLHSGYPSLVWKFPAYYSELHLLRSCGDTQAVANGGRLQLCRLNITCLIRSRSGNSASARYVFTHMLSISQRTSRRPPEERAFFNSIHGYI